MTNLSPITPIERSQDLTSKSLKISKQVILEKYAQERSKLIEERAKALGTFIKSVTADWGTYKEFSDLIKETIVARAKTQVRQLDHQTRLRNLLNSVLQFELKTNADLWVFPCIDWEIPSLNLLLDALPIHERAIKNKFKEIEGFDESHPFYSVTYTYSSVLVNSLDYDDDYNSRYSVDDSLPTYEIEVILPSNISKTIYELSDYLNKAAKIHEKLMSLDLKEHEIDTHLEKLEAQLLIKELSDSGNTEALNTIESIVQNATGDKQLLLTGNK